MISNYTYNKYKKATVCLVTSCLLLSACDLAPKYKPVQFALPDSWQGTKPFFPANPADEIPKGTWWTVFNDPVLNQLEEQLNQNNPDLQAAAETFMQSRAILSEVKSQLYPQLNLQAGGGKYKQSENRLFRSSTSNGPITETNTEYQGAALWEIDLWGRIRNQIKMQRSLAQVSAADYQSAKLSLQADLARHYMILRGYDAQNEVLKESIQYYEAAVDVTRMRQMGAIAAGIDVSRAENQLEMTKAQQTEVQAQRDITEHAIAILVNKVPMGFHIAPIKSNEAMRVPKVPLGIPSSLLQRRPDIASAERQMAAANRAIGVSKAAFYPDITINAVGGFQDKGFGLANMPNSMWSAAVQATLPLFQGGLRRATLQRSWSQYRQTEDNYRSVVLNAFKEVADNLTLTQRMTTKLQQNKEAVNAALRTQSMAMSLYTGGLTNYLDVVTAQNAALTARIAEVETKTSLMQASVGLIRALGGGWDIKELPAKNLESVGVFQYQNLRNAHQFPGYEQKEQSSSYNLKNDE
ncbi:efflux transporter outer membrane subunit [Commensalibacter oyaizuii]|uniref:Efflux transporter outer membrane subunit n=1 Tax=Commensalibacter oyaizuii TaxID=3043873 RepID=A0ABT6Q0S2_9PROT|nr:efflux transporter outer membrane subunit [Commensalibacter sp. TBRC 16381]MDI2090702.1 efflux transporter outer membrane subunit [Commensalibacter sp. TBRC 16381]